MSFDHNYKFWVATKQDLQQLIKRQNILKRMQPISDPLMSYKLFSELYILYVELVNKLGHVYQHTFQVQKRKIVRPLVEAATRTLLQLKEELKSLELSEYVYTDKALIARKLTPLDLVIWRSPNFLYRRPPEIQNIIYENKIFSTEGDKQKLAKQKLLKIGDAILLIQAHERARKSRVYKAAIRYDKKFIIKSEITKINYSFTHKSDQPMSIPVKRTVFKANYVKADECCRDLMEGAMDAFGGKDDNAEQENMIRNKAASVIQIAWRAHRNKKIVKQKNLYRETLLGIRTKRKLVNPDERADAVIATYKNELLKRKLDEDFIQLISDERTRLLQQRSPWIMEDISDHIRAWFQDFYDKVGSFHPFPEELKLGTVLVVIDETMTPMEYKELLTAKPLTKEEKKKLADKRKTAKEKEKENRRKQKMKEARRRKKMKAQGIIDIGERLKANKNIQLIENTMKQYAIDWRMIDEYLNKNHEAIVDWVTESELATIHVELRAIVDEYMRIEYELLRRALAADLKQKYIPTKIKKPKNKKKKGRKKRTPKDLTADRTLESLYNELKDAGIIEKLKTKDFGHFIADFNFVADDTRDEDRLTTLGPAKGDIKMNVQDCMLGMGEFHVDKPKSLILVGPFNNGKKLLCNIIASELDAVFMNISPEKTVSYTENLSYFVHVIMKVARAFQPTILFIQDAHRVFWKKIPKEMDDLNPRLLQKALIKKILKPIKKDDKIMLLGTSDAPWSAKPKMKKAFQKVLLIPKSDYGTSFLIWMQLVSEYAGDDNVDDYVFSALAKVMQSYNTGDVANNIAETLDYFRRMRLKTTPLQPSEFLECFLGPTSPKFPPEEKLLEKYNKWFYKANKLFKERMALKKKKEEKMKKKK